MVLYYHNICVFFQGISTNFTYSAFYSRFIRIVENKIKFCFEFVDFV